MSNSPPLKILVNQLWKPNFERQGISEEFRPFFIAYIGVEDQGDYNNVLATLVDKAKQDEKHTIVFDNSIPFEVDFDFMNMIKSELGKMDIYHLKNEDLLMFPGDYNQLFIRALQDVILFNISVEKIYANDDVEKFNQKARYRIKKIELLKETTIFTLWNMEYKKESRQLLVTVEGNIAEDVLEELKAKAMVQEELDSMLN